MVIRASSINQQNIASACLGKTIFTYDLALFLRSEFREMFFRFLREICRSDMWKRVCSGNLME